MGGNAACARTQLLWTSGVITNTAWQTYTITFTPTSNWCYISFEPYYITTCSGYINLLLDNISCIAPVNGTVSGTNALCFNACNGTATANPTSGTPPYTYMWTPGNFTTQNITGLCAGTYSCVITDANGQTASGTYAVTQPSQVAPNATSTNILCNGQCTGAANAAPTGGTPGYAYSWAPGGQTVPSVTGICSGSYTVFVTDTNGCSMNQTLNITEPAALSLSATSNNTSCANNNGSATVTPTGGTGPYTYQWSPSGGNSANATGLAPNTYTVLVTDANGCTQTTTVTINYSVALTVTLQGQTNVLCNGATTGDATVNATGNNPFTYSWNTTPVQTTATATGLPAGTYSVLVTDANGCTSQQTVTIAQPTAINILTTSTPTACSSNTGTAAANATGGTGPYTYLWTTSSQTTQTATALAAGSYTVTVTDANGCTQTQAIAVSQVSAPVANATASPVTVTYGDNTQLNASGGTTYSWISSTGLSCTNCANPTVMPLQNTTYCAVVIDNNGCTDTACVDILVELPCGTLDLNKIIPNAFSPNDQAPNDTYCVPANVCVKDFVIKVYDRLGEMVFVTDTYTKCWDGTYKGKPLNTAVFVYFLDCTLLNGEKYSQKGNISLIR
jgi:gliding motility-associated-like protein